MQVLLACACLAVASKEPETEVVEGLLIGLHYLKLCFEVSLLSVVKLTDNLLILAYWLVPLIGLGLGVVLVLVRVTTLADGEELVVVGILPGLLKSTHGTCINFVYFLIVFLSFVSVLQILNFAYLTSVTRGFRILRHATLVDWGNFIELLHMALATVSLEAHCIGRGRSFNLRPAVYGAAQVFGYIFVVVNIIVFAILTILIETLICNDFICLKDASVDKLMQLVFRDKHLLVDMTLLLDQLFSDHEILQQQCPIDLVRLHVCQCVILYVLSSKLKQAIRHHQGSTDPACRLGNIQLHIHLLSHPLNLQSP